MLAAPDNYRSLASFTFRLEPLSERPPAKVGGFRLLPLPVAGRSVLPTYAGYLNISSGCTVRNKLESSSLAFL